MPLTQLETPNDKPRRVKVLLYGPNGVGKSHFGHKMPAPLFINIEKNVQHYKCTKYQINTFQEIHKFLDEFLGLSVKEGLEYRTLVFDSLDKLEVLSHEVCLKEAGVEKMNDKYGAGYQVLTGLFEHIRNKLDKIVEKHDVHLVFISHDVPTRVYPLGEEPYDKLGSRLHKNIAPIFNDWCNIIAYAHRPIKVTRTLDTGWNKQQVQASSATENSALGDRVMQVEDSPAAIAKNTFNLKTINRKMPLDADVLMKYVDQANANNNQSIKE